jgi:DNA-binding transcriptional regulator YhcF (GntR family)
MRLWLSRSKDIPLREQLETQIALAVLSGEIPPGEPLPSVREIASRYRVHANTVAAAFKTLADQGWLESRKGSGMYVRSVPPSVVPAELRADHLLSELFRAAELHGVDRQALARRFSLWMKDGHPREILVVHPDPELRKIFAAEIAAVVPIRVRDAAQFEWTPRATATLVVALPGKPVEATHFLPLQLSSIPQSLAQWLPAPQEKLVGVASQSHRFLEVAKTMLLAAGFPPEALVLRRVRSVRDTKGLDETDAVVCDVLTARMLPKHRRRIESRLLADSSLQEIRKYLGM